MSIGQRKMKEDPTPRRENTDPVVSGLTTVRSGGVWQPKERQPSGNEESRKKKGGARIEEK